MTDWPWSHRTDDCKRLEMFETPAWAVDAILRCELMTPNVVDPCCGRGVMVAGATRFGYKAGGFDIEDWTGQDHFTRQDWLSLDPADAAVRFAPAFTVFMNPPFSLATDFVEHSFRLGAYKIVAFQRFAWWESVKRRDFWRRYPPQRIYVCESRATCWRLDISPAAKKNKNNTSGSTPTAHGFFVWERGQPAGPLSGRLKRTKGVEWWDDELIDPFEQWRCGSDGNTRYSR